ncbi:hypothetical protein DXV76_09885 [Rhodobacteraceae bacterium CCMM004]|nr:hypothetical protein DXV76_09885 [Rhodobacteraceae bacterium CCMM004]
MSRITLISQKDVSEREPVPPEPLPVTDDSFFGIRSVVRSERLAILRCVCTTLVLLAAIYVRYRLGAG